MGFLGVLDAKQSAHLRSRAIQRRFRKGQAVFHQGGVSDRVIAVLTGRVKVSTTTAAGNACKAGLLNVQPQDPATFNPTKCDVHPSQSGQKLVAQTVEDAYRAAKGH